VNLRGVVLGTKHAIRTMLPTGGGSVLNWSSTGGLMASLLPVGVYEASKAGVISITKQAAVEYGNKGIRANAICPGTIVTELSGGPEGVKPVRGLRRRADERRSTRRVAELAPYRSDRASYISGTAIQWTADGPRSQSGRTRRG
jgi:NAD(P)-dependent dehydrogenase (short-subunit alcohol dehydrogenase family)